MTTKIVKRTRKNLKMGELKFIERMITESFPTGMISLVCDSFDLWSVLTGILPELKKQILTRDGKLVIRPDSGDPVDIICGYNISCEVRDLTRIKEHFISSGFEPGLDKFSGRLITNNGKYYKIINESFDIEEFDSSIVGPIAKGVIELLWDIYGGTVNDQGYRVLDPHIGAIYGDSITLDRQIAIYERLAAKGFAATNIVLGVGSFTYQFNTRDTFGFAAKGAWFEVEHLDSEGLSEGTYKESYNIYKNPVTDDGTKKSLKGLQMVYKDQDGEYQVKGECSWEEENTGELQVIFEDGKFSNQTTLSEVRNKINLLV